MKKPSDSLANPITLSPTDNQAVAEASQVYAGITELEQVPRLLLSQLEEFFVNYHRIQGRKYQPLGWKKADAAIQTMERCMS